MPFCKWPFPLTVTCLPFCIHTQRYNFHWLYLSLLGIPPYGCIVISLPFVEWHSSCFQVFPTTEEAAVNILVHIPVALCESIPSDIRTSGIARPKDVHFTGAGRCLHGQPRHFLLELGAVTPLVGHPPQRPSPPPQPTPSLSLFPATSRQTPP